MPVIPSNYPVYFFLSIQCSLTILNTTPHSTLWVASLRFPCSMVVYSPSCSFLFFLLSSLPIFRPLPSSYHLLPPSPHISVPHLLPYTFRCHSLSSRFGLSPTQLPSCTHCILQFCHGFFLITTLSHPSMHPHSENSELRSSRAFSLKFLLRYSIIVWNVVHTLLLFLRYVTFTLFTTPHTSNDI